MAKNIKYVYDVSSRAPHAASGWQTCYVVTITGPKYKPAGAHASVVAVMNKRFGSSSSFVCELRDADRKRYIAKPDWEAFSTDSVVPYKRGQ